jgi:hypothetical protein
MTLIKLRNKGLAEGTLRNISFNLKHLAKHTDLDNPESVKYSLLKMHQILNPELHMESNKFK